MSWHAIGSIWDVEPGERKVIEVAGRTVAVLHTGDGLFCIDHRCPHAGAALGAGRFDRNSVICPQHKWRFMLEDGSHNKNPRVCPPAGVYQLRAAGERLEVEIEEEVAAKAGPSREARPPRPRREDRPAPERSRTRGEEAEGSSSDKAAEEQPGSERSRPVREAPSEDVSRDPTEETEPRTESSPKDEKGRSPARRRRRSRGRRGRGGQRGGRRDDGSQNGNSSSSSSSSSGGGE